MKTSVYNSRGRLFSERNIPNRDALIYTGDQHTMRSILTTAPLEDRDWKIYQKPGFMFGDAAPDTEQHLLAEDGQ